MKRYPVYKHSGVEWLGEIPEHWEVKKLNFLTKRIGDGIHSTPQYVDSSEYYFINGNNLVNGNIVINEYTRCVSKEEFEKYNLNLDRDTLLLSINGTIGNVAFYNNESVILGKSAAYITLKSEILRKFAYYFLTSKNTKNYFFYEVTGTTIFNLSLKSIKNTFFTTPPLSEQKTIAHFLDRKIEQIEQYIRNKQRLIELLNEQKTAIINRAATKGINPNAPMKHSGIEWLGEIPGDWNIIRLRFLILNGTQNGLYKPKEYYKQDGIPIISMGEAFSSPLINSVAKDRVQLTKQELGSYSLRTGDLLFARRSLVFEGSGKCSVVYDLPEVHIFESSIIRVRPNPDKIDPLFFLFFLNSAIGRLQILKITKQVTISGIDAGNLKDIVILLPSLVEQQRIISYINNKSSKIDLAIAQIEKEIELIQEYRTTLISDAVTGKIDVRGFDNGNYRENNPKDTELATM